MWACGALVVSVALLVILLSLPIVRTAGRDLMDHFGHSRGAPGSIASADLSGAGPGSLVSATTMPGFSQTKDGRSMKSARVVYRSTEGDNRAPTVVSGAVFTPLGAAPAGGWPVVSLGHGTLGLDEQCAPSLNANLLGQSATVLNFINKGYAVAVADYQGLGTEGIHPYTDARTAGLNIIDAVRALRHTFKGVSDRWGAFGGSQGGGATWAANEQAGSYAPELDLVGTVALVPAADISGFVDKAAAGTLTSDQRPAMQLILESLSRLHPDLNLDDYRKGAAVQYWNVLSACSGPQVHQRAEAMAALKPTDFSPRTPAAADRLRGLLKQWALPQRRLSAPLFVEYAAKDTFIDAQWTTDAIARACKLGGTIAWTEDPEKGHGDVDWAYSLTWLDERFAGRPATNDCSSQSVR
jgi:hypothetical protein